MATCLIALGSNLGDRAATLQAAIREIGSLPETRLARHSRWYAYPALGGLSGQPDFLNAAAVVDTALAPFTFFEHLLQIETQHGRRRTGRWAARTLDIDLLLYEDQVLDTPSLVVPHPRMSYRRFVLQPAAEIATDMVHPMIGWSIGELQRHLDRARDWAAIVSPSHAARRDLCELATTRFGAKMLDREISHSREIEDLWPASITTWLALPASRHQIEGCASISPTVLRQQPAAGLPKLTVLVDAPKSQESVDDTINWSKLQRQPGRGPTLWIRTTDRTEVARELSAAIESVWTHLGRPDETRVE
ncbi:MAG: 2-amino-4-hydroxy-6-hydroxymethyldihydropteridine diphosphokinase [Pirellulales bacterium]